MPGLQAELRLVARLKKPVTYNAAWFVGPATERAYERIRKFRPYFDGAKKEVIAAEG